MSHHNQTSLSAYEYLLFAASQSMDRLAMVALNVGDLSQQDQSLYLAYQPYSKYALALLHPKAC